MKKHKKHILSKQEVIDITSNDIDVCRRYVSELDSIRGDEKKLSRIKKNIGRIICKLRWRYGITISWLQVNSAKDAKYWLREIDIMNVERGICDDVEIYKKALDVLEELISNTATPNTLTRDVIKRRYVEPIKGTSPIIFKHSHSSGERTRKNWRNVIVTRK